MSSTVVTNMLWPPQLLKGKIFHMYNLSKLCLSDKFRWVNSVYFIIGNGMQFSTFPNPFPMKLISLKQALGVSITFNFPTAGRIVASLSSNSWYLCIWTADGNNCTKSEQHRLNFFFAHYNSCCIKWCVGVHLIELIKKTFSFWFYIHCCVYIHKIKVSLKFNYVNLKNEKKNKYLYLIIKYLENTLCI